MKRPMRLLSALLAALLLLSMLPTASLAAPASGGSTAVTGSISATVRIDYAQSLETLRQRGVQVELFQGGVSLGKVPLTAEQESVWLRGGYTAQVSLRNRDGGALGRSGAVGYLDLTVDGLPQGIYQLVFTGRGFVPFTRLVELKTFSRHIILGTGDATFTFGDVNGDGKVNAVDQTALSRALGSKNAGDLEKYDLNGDSILDIVDLAYIGRLIKAQGGVQELNTALLDPPVDLTASRAALPSGNTLEGNLSSLLQGSAAVTVRAQGDLALPIVLSQPVEMEQIVISSPEGQGAIHRGTLIVEDSSGNQDEIPFDNTLPAGIYGLSSTPGSSVITVSLGRRVPVKQVTIQVSRNDHNGYAVVESVQFLQDIVPENPVPANSEIKNLQAQEGDGRVSLSWDRLPNVSGYKVEYWLRDGNQTRRSVQVSVPQAQITGLENLKTYLFSVTPIDGSWQGKASTPVAATPMPAKAPDAPDIVSITEQDAALAVSWKASKGATYYKVFYTDKTNAATSAYTQFGGQVTQTSATITGLKNGTAYSVYVIAGNSMGESRPSRISTGTPKETSYTRPAGIPTQGILSGNDISSIRLAAPGNYLASAYTSASPFTPRNMADGDYRTHWTVANWWSNEHVICTFDKPVSLSAAIWVPRLDGSYATNLSRYSVQIWYQGEDTSRSGHLITPNPDAGGVDNGGVTRDVDTWIAVRGNPSVSKFAILPFQPVTNIIQISVAVEQRDYTAISLSELMFMEYDPARSLPASIDNLFADNLHTRLARGVTQAQIDALRTRLNGSERDYYLELNAMADELTLAEELLRGGETGGVVLRGLDSRTASDSKYGQGGSDLQPLGVAAGANQEITIYAEGIPAGQTVTVYATQFNAEASAWKAKVGTLQNGRNVLTVPRIGSQNTSRGGSLYFTYSGSAPERISLHVRRGTAIPVLELSDWYGMNESARRSIIADYIDQLAAYNNRLGRSSLQTNCFNVTEISTPTVLLSLPAAAVYGAFGTSSNTEARITALYQSVEAWEDVMHICKTTQGIDNTYQYNDMRSRQNIRCMQMFSGAFMYAAGSHIGIGYSSCAGMVGGVPVHSMTGSFSANQLYGWGIAHEIGHNMDKLGRAEITNNIYSLMVQTYDGWDNTLRSRLESSGKYAAIFTKTAQALPGESNDVFVQLGMYWQLHLAYDEGEYDARGPMWFYNQFFKAWKSGQYFAGASSYDDKVALTAAGVTGMDLTEFFTRWGMTLSQSTRKRLASYRTEDRAIWYLSDQSRRDRLDGVRATTGSISASAVLVGDNTVRVTITPRISGSVQGYEILRNGVSIGFTTSTVFTDTIGSGNHRTYEYTVVAYDTLGNAVNYVPAYAGEIRVAYDMTVPAGSYSVSSSGSTVTFQLHRETAVTGIKLPGSVMSWRGPFTVTVTSQDGRTSTALSSSFTAANNQAVDDTGSFVAYFKKPGANALDTRIWTYDAKTVTVTGVPAGTQVELISYAGDDIAFLEGATMGRLAYDYGGIRAGTLVIVGTYRSDPLYALIKIKGRFTVTTDAGETRTEERYLSGRTILFSELPEDQEVSDISDGLFLFVPDIQQEAELQNADMSLCSGENLLPSMIRAELTRSDDPTSTASQRGTAETVWINTPGGTDLPVVILEG